MQNLFKWYGAEDLRMCSIISWLLINHTIVSFSTVDKSEEKITASDVYAWLALQVFKSTVKSIVF